ncbi:efflux RND transporter periplasmic adaptor subunit [Limibacillus halophilus]|uniref:Membrane fusion protein (Multidrug efflux system) n=1 Tax=Limibacillus halophilus TaxID=1579333 RepID=A0A839STJ7_9PROT|nr:efflux RND transporter periplasmic adaptor subunit [Limibacillus halophilus]MBB3064305.1 membrane fusion protein (multidrug efflux system) [Limibacillus halophilus]
MTIFRQVLFGVLLLMVAFGVWQGQRWNSPPADSKLPNANLEAVPVTLATVAPTAIVEAIEAVGSTQAHQAINIVPLADGQIMEISFTPGSQVEAGQVLVRLDDEAERAEVEELEAYLTKNTQALDRAKRLLARQNVSQATVDDLLSERDAALARLQGARKALADRVVRAPYSGIVGFKELDIGARVEEGQIITTLDDLSVIDVEFSVPGIQYTKVRLGMTARITIDAFPGRTFNAIIDRIDTRIGQASRAFRVRATLPNPDILLPAGLFVTVTVVVDERTSLAVPEEAIVAEANGSIVFVVTENKVERRPISVGVRTGNLVEVISGVSDGERIVHEGVQRLRDGSLVRVLASGEQG